MTTVGVSTVRTRYTSLCTDSAAAFPMPPLFPGLTPTTLATIVPASRPGSLSGVVTPLADLGLGKSRVRGLARYFGLSNADLPASPCLASRIAYGTEVTAERLHRVELAEGWLRGHGLSEFRVRLHQDELARIEVPKDQIGSVVQLDSDGSMTRAFQELGFKFVTIDLEGFRSGSMNRVLSASGTTHLLECERIVH